MQHDPHTLISSYTVNGVTHYPHYWSTYCIHLNHADCRMTCKTCQTPCLCPCHRPAQRDGDDRG
jgi:hypothetical protein